MTALPPTNLAFLLHMHQPHYVDPDSGHALMPWVRLHGARAYLDVARLLDEFGAVQLTVNFVPSLLEQLEGVGAGVRDPWQDLTLRPTGEWSADERAFIISRFFSIDWNRGVDSRPRFRALLDKRGRRLDDGAAVAVATGFSDNELRDLTVLFHLAWLGFAAREDQPAIAELERRGRDFTDEDARLVISVGLAACSRVLPLYAKLAARGQVELATSPHFHPIVPLLCDSDAARRAMPGAALPERYAFPDDAHRQIKNGLAVFRRFFGTAVPLGVTAGNNSFAGRQGMWPPEGCLSPEAVETYGSEGVSWLASDEGNLWRSLAGPRDRAELYRAYRYAKVDLVFRDRELSDRIGFSYAHSETAAAVGDLLSRARHAGERANARYGDEASLVPVILDGENPWEAYPGSGEPFLRALFGQLSKPEEGVRPVTIGGHLAQHPARVELGRLHSGSWIDSDFHIWIGDPVKNRAWNLLGRARRRWQRAADDRSQAAIEGDLEERRRALEESRLHLDAAEGSDWFWWFGEPFHNAEEALFDRLFRAHLAAAWRALGDRPPAELDEPVTPVTAIAMSAPRSFITPRIDGRLGSYFEWVGAGRYDVPRGAAMAQVPLCTSVFFGVDAQNLYVRCDPHPEARARVAAAVVELELRVTPRELHLRAEPGAHSLTVMEHPATAAPLPDDEATPRAGLGVLACDQILELSLPLATLGLRRSQRLEFAIRLLDGEVMIARYPRDGYLDLVVQEEQENADLWL